MPHNTTPLSRLVSAFSPPGSLANEQQGYFDRLLTSITLITAGFALLYVAVSQIIGFGIGVALMLSCFILLLSILALFRATARYELCANLYLACCCFVAILGCSFFSGGIASMVLPWFTLVPLTAVLLLGSGLSTALWSALTCVVVAAYGVAGMTGYPFPMRYDSAFTNFFNMICIVGLVMILSMLAHVFGHNRKRAMATIQEQKHALQQALSDVEKLAFYDSLTQLPNRLLFFDRFRQALSESRRNGRYGALMFLDLDNFKPINDTHGHEAGDLLLAEAARRLTSCMREIDTVARLGGDEFAVILSTLDADANVSQGNASKVAQMILTTLSRPFVLSLRNRAGNNGTVHHCCTASIGVVLFLHHDGEHTELISQADRAMYQAKLAGKNEIRFHTLH